MRVDEGLRGLKRVAVVPNPGIVFRNGFFKFETLPMEPGSYQDLWFDDLDETPDEWMSLGHDAMEHLSMLDAYNNF